MDTNLVSTLLGGVGVNHQKSCNNVVALMKGRFGDDFAVGIIDNDKRRPNYLDACIKLAKSDHLQLYKHPQKHHYIITVSPAAEVFILDAAESAGVSLGDYDLPSDLKGLLKITKHVVTNKNPKLICLFRDLSLTGEFRLLGKVLNYLFEHEYKSNQDELVAFFNE